MELKKNQKTVKTNKIVCSDCGSTNVVTIMYGYPGPGAVHDSEEGKVHLGGCIVDVDNPKWHCKDCERDW